MTIHTPRKGGWIQTYSGKQFWPLDPRADEVDIEDISTALSRMCRYAGHCESFYSVAEHSFHVSKLLPRELALKGLLHDATEAYLVDVPKPIKPFLTGYMELEAGLWRVICDRYGLSHDFPDEIHQADMAMLLAEQKQIMKQPPADWNIPGKAAPTRVFCFSPDSARALFMSRFRELTGEG